MYGSLLKYTCLVAKDTLKLNNIVKQLFNNPEHLFILFLTIKYLCMLDMSGLSIA